MTHTVAQTVISERARSHISEVAVSVVAINLVAQLGTFFLASTAGIQPGIMGNHQIQITIVIKVSECTTAGPTSTGNWRVYYFESFFWKL